MSCDSQSLINLSAANKLSGSSSAGLAECAAYQASQHSGGGSAFTWALMRACGPGPVALVLLLLVLFCLLAIVLSARTTSP